MSNCSILKNGNEAVVVDPGEVIDEMIACLDGCTVRAIVDTHAHLDHCAGNAEIIEKTGAELLCHEEELPLLQALEHQAMMFGVPSATSPEPDRFIAEGDRIEIGDSSVGVIHTPGHSPGHICLVGDGFVVAGDVLFAGSIGRTDLLGGNHEQLLESIRTKLLPLPDETIVHTGHGPATTIGAERQRNPFLVGL